MEDLVSQVSSRLKDQGIDAPEEEIRSRLKMLIENFRVPEAEARRSVLNYFYKESGKTPVRAGSEKVRVSEIKEPGRWVEIEVKVLQLWQPTSATIAQTGLVGDETGRIKFTKWARDSSLPELVEGKSYLLKNVVTDEFQGRPSIKMTRTSRIEELEKDIQAAASALASPGQKAPSEEMKIADIAEPGRWVEIRAKVVQLWEPNSESISQTGLLGDETGSMKFVKWAKADLPDMEEGKSYHIKNVVTDEYQGRFSIKLNRTSQIEPLDEDIAVGTQAVDFTGALVEVQKGSGLIKRCPICNRSLNKNMCAEHGKVDGTYDLRIKGVLDDGRRVQDVLINREITENLTGMTLDEAKQIALEALDHEVVKGMIAEKLVGRYYTVTGQRIDRYILVQTISEASPIAQGDVDELLTQVEVD